MNKFFRIVQIVFAVPWLIFGTLHFLHVDGISKMVPAFFPVNWFWVYLTGTIMIVAGISFVINYKAQIAAVVLGSMLLTFLAVMHIPAFIRNPSAFQLLHVLEELSYALTAFILAGILAREKRNEEIFNILARFSRKLFAFFLIVFGIEHFTTVNFPLAQTPPYLPFQAFWIYLTGLVLIAVGFNVLFEKKAKLSAMISGVFLFVINSMNYFYLLSGDWTASNVRTPALLNLIINCNVFFLAFRQTADEQDNFEKI